MSAYSIGIDLGGTNLRVAAVSTDGFELDRLAIPARYESGPDRVLDDIVSTLQSLKKRQRGTLRGIGIGVPGYIDSNAGVVISAANLPGFEDFPMRDELQRRLDTPVLLENDANTAALGEMWMGAGRSVRDLILITLGTGIGGGIVYNGGILSGTMGLAGEIGHMTIYPNGNPCGCGNFGCLEKHASATAIAAMGKMLNLGSDITAQGVHHLAVEGNERALQVFESMGRALGIAITNLITLFNFPLFLLSGGPLPAWDFFAPTMLEEIRKRSYTYRRFGARIEKAVLGADAGLFGAAYLPMQQSALPQSTLPQASRCESAASVG